MSVRTRAVVRPKVSAISSMVADLFPVSRTVWLW